MHAQIASEKASLVRIRRGFFAEQDWPNYEQIVSELLALEDSRAEAVAGQVLTMLSIPLAEFNAVHGKLAADPLANEMVMAAQKGQLNLQPQKSLERAKMLECLQFQGVLAAR